MYKSEKREYVSVGFSGRNPVSEKRELDVSGDMSEYT